MQSTQQATREGSRPESVAGNVNNPAQHSEPTCPPKVRSHETIHRFRVKPADAGIVGSVDGGKLLEWIDKAAYAAAAQWSGRYCVTAYVGNIHLDRPISVGELVELHASLVYTGRSSMHILVTVYSSDPTRAKAVQTSQCPIIFVAVDDTGNPVEVPRGHRSRCLNCNDNGKRGSGYRCANASKAPWPPKATPQRAPPPAPRCASSPPPPTSTRAAKSAAAESCGGSTKRPTCAEPIGPARKSSRPTSPGSASTGPSSSADVIEVTARIIHTGPRSIHTSIHVTTTDTDGGQPCLAAHGLAVVVSLDERGKARPVPKWEPDSDEDHRLDQHARHLIELRQFIEPFTTAAAVPADAEPTHYHHNTIAH